MNKELEEMNRLIEALRTEQNEAIGALNDAEKVRQRIEDRIEEFAKQQEKPVEGLVMWLELCFDSDHIEISIGGIPVFDLQADGFRFKADYLEVYEQWIDGGCQIDEAHVQWKGREYYLLKRGHTDVKLCSMIKEAYRTVTAIFDFKNLASITQCTDPRIQKHKHNGAVVVR